jgi:hypothetical protein
MKKAIKIVGICLLLGIIGIISYLKLALPNVGNAPEISIKADSAMIKRGEYLAFHVMLCMDCHSKRDWTAFSGPYEKGTEGRGGEIFDQTMNFPGSYTSKNITPTNLKDWTDGEIFRAITTGVNKHGKALFSVMPYTHYGTMDSMDILSVIAYIRTLKPIESKIAESVPDFPLNFLLNTIPQKAKLTKIPPKSDTVAYGAYLTNAAACYDCHTKQEQGKYFDELAYAGGFEFKFPNGNIVRSVNITPDKETGIGNWDKATFLSRFQTYRDSSQMNRKVKSTDFNSVMPWTMYAGMTDADLSAIFAYLKTMKPIKQSVEKFTPAK